MAGDGRTWHVSGLSAYRLRCNTQAMQWHISSWHISSWHISSWHISSQVAPNAHGVLILDRARHNDHQARRSRQHHAAAITARGARVASHGEHLAVTGCRTASSNPAKKSSCSVARPGTSSLINRGRSCPSVRGNGRIGFSQCSLI